MAHNLEARHGEVLDHRPHMLGAAGSQLQPPTGNPGCHQIGSCFNTIGDHRKAIRNELFDSFNLDFRGACPLNVGSHPAQIGSQGYDLRFLGSMLKDGYPVSEGCGHHEVFGAGNSHLFEVNHRTLQPGGSGIDIAVLEFDVHPHLVQPFQVEIDRSRANGASSRK